VTWFALIVIECVGAAYSQACTYYSYYQCMEVQGFCISGERKGKYIYENCRFHWLGYQSDYPLLHSPKTMHIFLKKHLQLHPYLTRSTLYKLTGMKANCCKWKVEWPKPSAVIDSHHRQSLLLSEYSFSPGSWEITSHIFKNMRRKKYAFFLSELNCWSPWGIRREILKTEIDRLFRNLAG
jgi:hypothetical protein